MIHLEDRILAADVDVVVRISRVALRHLKTHMPLVKNSVEKVEGVKRERGRKKDKGKRGGGEVGQEERWEKGKL